MSDEEKKEDEIKISMSREEAAALKASLEKAWHQPIVRELIRVLGESLGQ